MDENIGEKAYRLLFPDAVKHYVIKVEYSGRVKDYTGNVSMRGKFLEFKLSRKWYTISEDIQIGIIQELLSQILKKKKHSFYIDLYNNFVKNLHMVVPKDKIDPELKSSFDRVNQEYFLGLVEQTNLKWGRYATTTFGSYNFNTDTITMSKVFKELDPIYMDYVMFHEMLHKQRKFRKSGSKTYYHDSKFRRAEKVFRGPANIEKALSREVGKLMRSKKRDSGPISELKRYLSIR